MKVFKKICNFLQILTKKSLGSVLFSMDGRVTANIHTFLASCGTNEFRITSKSCIEDFYSKYVLPKKIQTF